MSLLQVNTAIPLAKPLLEPRREQLDEDDNIKEDARLSQGEYCSRTKCLLFGALTGFFIQMVSLGAYAYLLIRFKGNSLLEPGYEKLLSKGTEETGPSAMLFFKQILFGQSSDAPQVERIVSPDGYFGKDAILYTVLSVLTQVDLIVYVLIWVAFTCTMTRSGMACIRSQFFGSFKRINNDVVPRRYVFVLCVSFLVGIVLGALAAWSAVDVFLGFPIPFEPILVTVAVDLALCYMMVCCFDMGGKGSRTSNNYATEKITKSNTEEEEEEIVFEYINTDEDSDCEDFCC